eukprot:6377375-Lingulodinium_polyedra.AAC.1
MRARRAIADYMREASETRTYHETAQENPRPTARGIPEQAGRRHPSTAPSQARAGGPARPQK